MREPDGETIRIRELVGMLEQCAKAHRNARDKSTADSALAQWYSTLRQLSAIQAADNAAARNAADGLAH